jgi:hypothetical protein
MDQYSVLALILCVLQGSTSEYLSRVSLMSTPQRVFHGSGMSAEAARDSAALEALKFLEELGKGDG